MIEYEIVKHDKIKGIRVLVNTISFRSIHMHHDNELLYVISGSGTVNVKNRPYPVSQGDTILINAYNSHEIISSGTGFTLVIIQFSGHFLQDYCSLRNILFRDISLKEKMPEDDYQAICRDILELAESYLEGKGYFRLFCISRLSGILYRITAGTDTVILSDGEYSRRTKAEKRMNRISEYIENNYQYQIRLSDLADKEGITVTHLSHFIREQFGVGFQDYLKNKRLENAVRMIHSTRTFSEISDICGFSELKYMNKAFSEAFGMTPAQYREANAGSIQEHRDGGNTEYIYPEREAIELIRSLNYCQSRKKVFV